MTENSQYRVKGTLHRAYAIENVLTPKECEEFIQYIEGYSKRTGQVQSIEDDREITQKLMKRLQPYLSKFVTYEKCGCLYELVGVGDFVTISKHKSAINIHIDEAEKDKYKNEWRKDLHCLFKAGIYLNDVSDPNNPEDKSGGTAFYDMNKRFLTAIKPAVGKAFIFSMSDYHSGVEFSPKKTKYLIGFRLLYKLKKSCADKK